MNKLNEHMKVYEARGSQLLRKCTENICQVPANGITQETHPLPLALIAQQAQAFLQP